MINKKKEMYKTKKIKNFMENAKTIIKVANCCNYIITLLIINPFSWDDGGRRTVVQTMSGN